MLTERLIIGCGCWNMAVKILFDTLLTEWITTDVNFPWITHCVAIQVQHILSPSCLLSPFCSTGVAYLIPLF